MTEGVMKSNGVRERWTFGVLHHSQDVPAMVLDVSYRPPLTIVLGLAHAVS
jgi:hypothetical protein